MNFLRLTVFLCYFYTTSGLFFPRKNGINFLLDEFIQIAEEDPKRDAIETFFIDVPLDHFDDKNDKRFKMRYYQRLDMWKPNGPIYLFLGGESTASPSWLQIGLTYQLANETNGALFGSEHRYYGQSKSGTKDLQFLNSRQALADNAQLLQKIKTLPQFQSSKVVVVGGSYAGNLAAWMKLLYPDLVDAAIASSAPVLAKMDFFEYVEMVGDDFKQYGTPGCYDLISKKFARYEELLKTADGIKQLKKEENICEDSDLTKPLNQQLFFEGSIDGFSYLAQYASPDAIKSYCKSLADSENILIAQNESTCQSVDFNELLYLIKATDSDLFWTYQTCAEFGYYPTTNSKKQPFGSSLLLDYSVKLCQGLFSPDFNEKHIEENVRKTNEMYKGLHPNITNVIFVNGAIDPWHRLGVLEDLSNLAPAKVIPYASHCNDLLPDNHNDSIELRKARAFIKSTIKIWIGA